MARVAIASTDGKVINEHFGRAVFFHIFDLTHKDFSFVESRDTVAVCQHNRSHNTTDFDRVISLLTDCDGIFVSQIGQGAAAYLISKGVRVFEAPGFIEDVLAKVIEDRLFEKK